MNDAQPLINIAICSCQRPRLLSQALGSLAAMQRPHGIRLLISVIDNDRDGSARPVFDQWAPHFGDELVYQLERKRGIPCARNNAIDVAHEHGADYLIFIDDDEWVEPNWLCELYGYAIQLGGQAVVHGGVVPELPEGAPAYMREIFFEKRRATGTELGSCATNNVLIPIFVTRDLALRFDESRPLAGGTDTIFFCAAVERGVKIFECADARVHEEIPLSRLSSRWLAKRKYRAGITLARRKRAAGRTVTSLLFSSIVQIAMYALLALLARISFLPVPYYKALMKLSRSVGVLSGLFGAEADSYKEIEGA
ncbi:glycosyltransferase family 2 protein [Spongiibacter tropicus]|uniref:glycosyltransferase family 2 protein n=1 Tax=Spongiibacter tropicus TaxID=454602 RepID=UPI0003B55ED7|nr:glycosyltransferase [Spongiibacter tropicus]